MKKTTIDSFYQLSSSKKDDGLAKPCLNYNNDNWYEPRKPIGFTLSYLTKTVRETEELTCSFILFENVFILPKVLELLVEEIEDSKYILELENDWDSENAPIPDKNLYLDAVQFLVDYSLALYNVHKVIIDAPEINPCHDGSIDLSWRTDEVRLLINLKIVDRKTKVLFYRDHYQNSQSSKGELSLNSIDESFLIWMKFLK